MSHSDPSPHQDLAIAVRHFQSGRLREAEEACRQELARQPLDHAALHLLGILAFQGGQVNEAATLFQRAIGIQPNVYDYHNSLGILLAHAGRHHEAILAFHAALRLNKDFALAHHNLALALEQTGNLSQAIKSFYAAIASSPAYAEAHNHLGNALRNSGRLREAVAAHQEAIRLRPNYSRAYNNLAASLAQQGRLDEALAAFRQARDMQPASPAAHSDYLYILHHDPAATPQVLLDEALQWAQRHGNHVPASHQNDRNLTRRLRIGYVSPDFRRHTIAHLIAPVLAAHDRQQVEVFCYSAVKKEDSRTQEMRSLADHWRSITPLSFAQASELIRQDRIDILVDLAGHMGDNRLPMFALNPAPVQVQLGYAGTTGLAGMDYRLTDAYCDPPGMTERYHTETLVRLPACAWLYEPDSDSPPVEPLPATTASHITFGSLHRLIKLTDEAIALWSQVLNAVPNSRLILRAEATGPDADYHVKRFTRHGISRDRLEALARLPRKNYLQIFNRIDICLDTFPYNGDTTTCDALWMGVPTLTLAGDSFHSRRGVSHMSNMGLEQWVANSQEEFVAKAISFASNIPRLAALRAGLREAMSRSPLMDYAGYTRHLEAAYRRMWQEWCSRQ